MGSGMRLMLPAQWDWCSFRLVESTIEVTTQ